MFHRHKTSICTCPEVREQNSFCWMTMLTMDLVFFISGRYGGNLGNPLRLDLSPVRQLGFYDRLLEEYKGKTSTSTEDICAEVYQRLYARYQSDKDIASLRRVFQVYSFKNAELGYCQAWSPLFFGLRTESRG
jgi:hypothetical protein